MKQAIASLPAELVRTITWDQNRELSSHAEFTIDTGVQGYCAGTAAQRVSTLGPVE